MAANPERVRTLFETVSQLTDPAARANELDRGCGDDTELRAEVEARLRADVPLDPGSSVAGMTSFDPDRTRSVPAARVPESSVVGTTSLDPDRPRPVPAADSAVGGEHAGVEIAGRYRLVAIVGEGGMGSVWRAEQTEPVKRSVAVKLIRAGMNSRQVLARFEAERQALAMMDHPNIARVLDGGLHDGRPFFVMELVPGVPITEFCDDRRLTPRERLELFVSVCQAIQHAHQKGIIHRDIKPSNILVALHDGKPLVKVIDFGVVKAIGDPLTESTIDTGIGNVIGTPQYMSPEQASFDSVDIDTRSDVYALGVLLYELLTGSPPFSSRELARQGLMEILRVVREEDPPRPSDRLAAAEALPSIAANRSIEPRFLTALLREELDWVVMKSLEKDRAQRYETASGFAADVQRHLAGEPVQAHPPSAVYRARKFVRRHRARVIAASLVVVALLVGMAGTTWGLVKARRQEAEARHQERLAQEAVIAEKAANEEAQRRLSQLEKGNKLLASIFQDLNIRQVKQGTEPLEVVLARRLVDVSKQLEGESIGDPLAVAQIQGHLGESLFNLGFPTEAAELFAQSYQTLKARKGAEDPETLVYRNNLALAYRSAGKGDLALPLLEEGLKIQKATQGDNHPHTLTAMGNLAVSYKLAGKVDQALALFQETLERQKATLGIDHPETLRTMTSFAVARKDVGQIAPARSMLEETVKRQTAVLGEDHPDTLLSRNNLATVYLATGDLDQALAMLEATLKLQEAKLGEDHPDTLNSRNSLASAYQAIGKLDRAVPLFEETLRLRTAKQGAEHPSTITSMGNLAVAYQLAGKPDQALPLLESVVKLQKAKRGPNHPATLVAMNNLAVAYAEADRPAETVPLVNEALAVARGQLPPGSPRLANQLATSGQTLLRAGAFADAEPICREALSIREKVQPDAWSTFSTMAAIGESLVGQKKYNDAEDMLTKGYEGMKARERTIPPPARHRLPEVLDRLIELYRATARSDEAARYEAVRAQYPAAR